MVSVTALILSAVFFRKAFSKPVFISLLGAVILSALTIFSVQLIPEKIYVNVAPEADEIEAVSIYDYNALGSSDITDLLYGINYLNISDESEVRNYKFLTEEAKEKAVKLHKKILSEETRNNIYSNSYYENGYTALEMEYRLKNGKAIKRLYNICTEDILDEYVSLFQTNEGMGMLESFQINTEEVLFATAEFTSDNTFDHDAFNEKIILIENVDFDKLLDCIKKDYQNEEAPDFLCSADLRLNYWNYSELDSELCIAFWKFSETASDSVRDKMKNLSPREMLVFEDRYMDQKETEEEWIEKNFFYISEKDGYTVSYLKDLGYKF